MEQPCPAKSPSGPGSDHGPFPAIGALGPCRARARAPSQGQGISVPFHTLTSCLLSPQQTSLFSLTMQGLWVLQLVGKETEAQRGSMTGPRTHSSQWRGWDGTPGPRHQSACPCPRKAQGEQLTAEMTMTLGADERMQGALSHGHAVTVPLRGRWAGSAGAR